MMDTLPKDMLLVIIKKITEFGAEDLVRFETAFPFYREFTRDKATLRALPHSCVWYLADHSICEGKRKLMRQISHSGHGMFGVASKAQMLQRDNPNLEEIKLILQEVVAQRSDSASYFDLILKVLAIGGFSHNEILPVLKDLFERRCLAECGRALANIGGIPFFWEYYWTRPLPLGLEHKFACSSKGTCQGHGRRPNIFWPLTGDYEEYMTIDLCLLCRLM